jgi:hypothetical protein
MSAKGRTKRKPYPCPIWCGCGKSLRKDDCHTGEDHPVPLSLVAPGRIPWDISGRKAWVPAELQVSLVQDGGAFMPVVEILGGPAGRDRLLFDLAYEEAKELAEVLLGLCREVHDEWEVRVRASREVAS